MCAPGLFVFGAKRKILQRGVRGNGKDTGHCLQLRTCRMQG